jgi:hypothetical protein
MTRHLVEVDSECPQCGLINQRALVAESRAYGLRFCTSMKCSRCSFGEETDGPELTQEARAAFGAQEGCWAVAVADLGNVRFDALRLLREFLSDTPTQLLRRVKEGSPLMVGTLVEIEQIAIPLGELGVRCSVERVA